MTYADLVASIKAWFGLGDDGTDPTTSFMLALPRIIENAELRCFRDVDFLAAHGSATVTLAANASTIATPTGWLIGRSIVVTGIGRLERRAESFLDVYWPDRTATGTPKYWDEPTAGTLLISPTPALSYPARLTYTKRLTGLSAGVATTWLSLNAPDLLLNAALKEGSGWKGNFGAASDNPQQAMSFEGAYQVAKAAAEREESRRKAEHPTDAASPSPPIPANAS